MKTIITITLAAVLTAGTFKTFAQSSDDPLARLRQLRAQEQQQIGGPSADTAMTPADTTQTTPPPTAPEPVVEYTGSAPASLSANSAGTNGITLNFRNAPLELVLNYLSDAAGFIIVLDTPVRGSVNVISSHPMTKDEAVDLLNSVLNQNGLAAIRDGRTLTIMSKSDAIHNDIPVKVNNDPESIPKNDEIVTQVIPIRFVAARQLLTDLSSFTSPQATIVANEEGNSIVITDTQANIRHLVEIIKAIDSSAEAETEIRVFHLRYANPTDVANMLAGIFPTSSGNTTQSPIRFGNGAGGRGGGGGGRGGGGFGGGGGGGFGGGGGPAAFFAGLAGAGAQGSGQNDRIQKAQQVLAVADLRTSSVVVTAEKDLMSEIEQMIEKLDVNSSRDQKVYVFHVNNADPQEALQVLQTMFPNNSNSRNTQNTTTTSALQTRETQNNSSGGAPSTTSSSSTGIGGAGGGGGRGGGNF